ncbi:MAG: 16S rRNA (adenine(1518)-N(6)/adenine(1519)-N(6))-dimethyltransferase RsmA [Candidatus Micrarchaeia archaeon]
MLDFVPKKRLGQSFLINQHIAEIEAAHAVGKNVLELGPGLGILTKELCKVANKVVAVELDRLLFLRLSQDISASNLKLVNKDFFKASSKELELDKIDIMIANIPYNLSSKTIGFLENNQLQGVLCLQKEFVEHMLAKPNTRKYSKLSVMAQLTFSMTKIMDVSRGNFVPVPKVDSCIVYLKPKAQINNKEEEAISGIMQHKKKTLRNALIDALKRDLAIEEIEEIAKSTGLENERVFALSPEKILEIAKLVSGRLNGNGKGQSEKKGS